MRPCRRQLCLAIATLAVASCSATGVWAQGLSMYDRASRDQRELFDRAAPDLIRQANKAPLDVIAEGEGYFWDADHRIDPLIDAYQFTQDTVWLDRFVSVMNDIRDERWEDPNAPYAYTGWYTYEPSGNSYLVIHGALAYYNPALKFIREVRANPSLQAQYGAIAEQWFDDITQGEIPAWDLKNCWKDLGGGEGWYVKPLYEPNRYTGAIEPWTNSKAGSSYATNKLNAMIESLCILYELTGDPWYRDRIEKCQTYFRNMWHVSSQNAWWYYRPRTGSWDYNSDGSTKFGMFVHERSGYYATDILAVVAAYELGLVYTEADIDKLVQTNTEYMWLGSTTNPKFRKLNGDTSHNGQLWTALAPYSGLTRQLWRAVVNQQENSNYWAWENNATEYVVGAFESKTTAYAGSDQTVVDADNDGVEVVWLVGVQSMCTDGTITHYLWTEDGAPLGYDSFIPAALTPGEHTITLTVTTDYGAKNTDTVTVTVEPGSTPGDVDGDGDVDLDDFVIVKQNFGTPTGATRSQGDLDGDGDVDLDDFVVLKQNFGAGS